MRDYPHGKIRGRLLSKEYSEIANKFPKEQVCPAPKNKAGSVLQWREEGERGWNGGQFCELPIKELVALSNQFMFSLQISVN